MPSPYNERLNNLRTLVQSKNTDAVLIENPIDLYYLSGIDVSAGKILIDTEQATLFVDGRYLEVAQVESAIPTTLYTEHFLEEYFKKNKNIKNLVFDSQTTSYSRYQQLQKTAQKFSVKCSPLSEPMVSLRIIKDEEEITCLRQAALLGCEGFDYVCSLLKEGITEKEIAIELEIFWKRHGGEKLAFDPIISFGANSSKPHYRPGFQQLLPHHPVLIDIGVTLNHYHSDMTRTVFFGTPNPEMEKIYDIVKQAQEEALALCKPGVNIAELDNAARKVITDAGYGDAFPHSLGHGVGLEVHELPNIRNHPTTQDLKATPGMVFTIEPGIYLPGIGGVRIEDTIVITADGYENLTPRSKELMII